MLELLSTKRLEKSLEYSRQHLDFRMWLDTHSTAQLDSFLNWYSTSFTPRLKALQMNTDLEMKMKLYPHRDVLELQKEFQKSWITRDLLSRNPLLADNAMLDMYVYYYLSLGDIEQQPRSIYTGMVNFSPMDAWYIGDFKTITFLYETVFLQNISWNNAIDMWNKILIHQQDRLENINRDLALLDIRIQEIISFRSYSTQTNKLSTLRQHYEDIVTTLEHGSIQYEQAKEHQETPQNIQEYYDKIHSHVSKTNGLMFEDGFALQNGYQGAIIRRIKSGLEAEIISVNTSYSFETIQEFREAAVRYSKVTINEAECSYTSEAKEGYPSLFKPYTRKFESIEACVAHLHSLLSSMIIINF